MEVIKSLEGGFVDAASKEVRLRTVIDKEKIDEYNNALKDLINKVNKTDEEKTFLRTYIHEGLLDEPVKSLLIKIKGLLQTSHSTTSSDVDGGHIDNKHNRAPHGMNGVLSIESLFDGDVSTNVLLIPPDSDFKIISATAPGVMTKSELMRLNEPITKLTESIFGEVNSKTINAMIHSILQIIVLTQTSSSTQASDIEDIQISLDGKTFDVSYGAVRDTISKPFEGTAKPNALRRFGRSMSASIVNGISNGTLKVNTKIMAKWGVPKQFYPYTVDCVIPEDGRDGLPAVLAKILSTIIAIRQNQSLKSNVVHNALEQSTGGLKILDTIRS